MLAFLARIFAAPILQGTLGQLADVYKARLAAGEDSAKIAADLAAQQAAILVQREAVNAQILIAEQGSWITRGIRPGFAYPFIIYFAKLLVWDKVLGLGVTDDLSSELKMIAGIIITGYFGTLAVERGVKIFKK